MFGVISVQNWPMPAILQAVYYTSKIMGAAPYNISPTGFVTDSTQWLWYSRFFHVFLGIVNVLQVNRATSESYHFLSPKTISVTFCHFSVNFVTILKILIC